MQGRSQETHAQILTSASRLFSEKGYSETSVAEICTEAGISKGAFYYHFSTKQDLFLALLENWLVDLEAAFKSILDENTNVPEAILSMTRMAGGVVQSADATISIILEFWMQAYRDPAIWQAAISPYLQFLKYFTNIYERGIAEGSLKTVDPEIAARVTVSIGMGLLLQALFNPKETQWDIVLQKSMQMFIESLTRRSN